MIKFLICATILFAALAAFELIFLIRAVRISNEAVSTAKESQRIAKEAQDLAEDWRAVALRRQSAGSVR